MTGQQLFQPLALSGIAQALGMNEGGALFGCRQLERFEEQILVRAGCRWGHRFSVLNNGGILRRKTPLQIKSLNRNRVGCSDRAGWLAPARPARTTNACQSSAPTCRAPRRFP